MSLSTTKTTIPACREKQKEMFHLLQGYAFQVSARYSHILHQPGPIMYEAFARLFQSKQPVTNLHTTKERLAHFIISICSEMETESSRSEETTRSKAVTLEPGPLDATGSSSKQIIDLLRTLSFTPRVVYNMAVIDRFDFGTISSTLKIPLASVEQQLQIARKQLASLLIHHQLEESTHQS